MKIIFQCLVIYYLASLLLFSGCHHVTSPYDEPLTAPTYFSITPFSDKSVEIFWEKGNASNFDVERKMGNDSSFVKIGSTTYPYIIDYNLDSSKFYYYRVQASRGDGAKKLSAPFKIGFTASNQLIRTISNNIPINGMILSPDGNYLAFYDNQLAVNIINTANWSILRYSNNNIYFTAIAFTPNSKAFCTGELSCIKIRSIADGALLNTITTDSSFKSAIVFAQDGNQLISSETKNGINKLTIWNVTTGKNIKVIDSTTAAYELAMRPDSNILIACGGSVIHVWDINQQKLINQKSINCNSPVVNHNGSLLAVSTARYTGSGLEFIREYFNTIDFSLLYSISLGNSMQNPLSFSSDNSLQVIGNGNQVKIARVSDGTILQTTNAHTGIIVKVAFFPDNRTFATASYDGTIKIWSTILTRQWTIIQ